MTRPILTAIALTIATTVASALIAGQSRAHEAPTGWSYPNGTGPEFPAMILGVAA